MAFTAIPNSSIDADSPLDTTLMTYLRDNDDYLKARFNISSGHNHDGTTDSGAPVSVPDGAITQAKLQNAQIIDTARLVDGNVTLAKLSMAQGSWSNSAAGTFYIAIQRYSHSPRLRLNAPSSVNLTLTAQSGYSWTNFTGDSGQLDYLQVVASSSITTMYVYWDYHS